MNLLYSILTYTLKQGQKTTTQCVVQVSHCCRCHSIKARYTDSFNLEETLNHDRTGSQKGLLGFDLWRHLSPALSWGRTTPKADLFAQGLSKLTGSLLLGDKEKNLNHVLPLTTFQTFLMFGNMRKQNDEFRSSHLYSPIFHFKLVSLFLITFLPTTKTLFLLSELYPLKLPASLSTIPRSLPKPLLSP